MSPIESAVLKLAVPSVVAAILLVRFRKSPLLRDALVWPSTAQAVGWAGVYLAWMLGTDLAIGWRGPWDFAPWQDAPWLASALRVAAVVVAGPVLEELVFRGIAFGALLRRGLGAPTTIALTAIVWSLLHVDYSPTIIAVIAVQGIILGCARWRSDSLLLPTALHMAWNLYAVW